MTATLAATSSRSAAAGDDRIEAAWRRQAEALADWAWARLVNRTDVWGGYLPLRYRVPGGSKSVTRPPKALRGQVALTRAVLACHFYGRDVSHVVGTHTTSPENTSLWGLIDLDAHGDGTDPPANERAALYWYQRLVRYGFTPLLTRSDERGGLHLRVLFERPAPTPRVHAFLRELVADHAHHGVAGVEVFPKQPRLPPGGLGNWARVPGPHHTRPVWAGAWDGRRWVAGEQAISVIVGCAGDPPSLIPTAVVVPPPPRPAGLVVTNLPERTISPAHAGTRERMTDAEVALACLAAIDNTAGGGRHYDEWLAVGMVLHDLDPGPGMLAAWVAWSRRSAKHVEGVCEAKWPTFGTRSGWTLGSLVKWARDGGVEIFPHKNNNANNGGGRAA